MEQAEDYKELRALAIGGPAHAMSALALEQQVQKYLCGDLAREEAVMRQTQYERCRDEVAAFERMNTGHIEPVCARERYYGFSGPPPEPEPPAPKYNPRVSRMENLVAGCAMPPRRRA